MSEIEFTIDLPCRHFSPASITLHFELSTITGRREISSSAAIWFRKRVIAASESIMPSSMFTSRMFAPPRTWSSAIAAAPSKSPALITRSNFLLPVMLVRSPTITNGISGENVNVSSPL